MKRTFDKMPNPLISFSFVPMGNGMGHWRSTVETDRFEVTACTTSATSDSLSIPVVSTACCSEMGIWIIRSSLQLNHKVPAPGTVVSALWLLTEHSDELDAVYRHVAQVEADADCGLCKGNSVNEKDVCGWKKGDGMRQLYPHVYLLKNYSDRLFVYFRPLEMNQPTSYRPTDNLSYSLLKLFLTGLLVIHIPQWHKSTWKILRPCARASSMWQWHSVWSVVQFKVKYPRLKKRIS